MNRSGSYILQPAGYKAFIPTPLPPELILSPELKELQDHAERSLAQLNGICHYLQIIED